MKTLKLIGARVGQVIRENGKTFVVVGVTAAGMAVCRASTDATDIIDAATTAFASVATLCVAIGTFFVVYKLVRKVK